MRNSKDFLFCYQNMLTTDRPICRHYLLVRCIPQKNACQELKQSNFLHYGFDEISTGVDSFKNTICYGGALAPHRSLMWQSSGIVSLKRYEFANIEDVYIYTLPTKLTCSSAAIKEFLLNLKLPQGSLDQALFLMNELYAVFSYRQNVSTIKTTAAQSFKLKSGVCQDYAHLILCFLRYFKIPSRYVTGLIEGDGMTHAWIEVLADNIWYGLDPTHNRLIDYGYIKLAHGRDANDCPVSRGVFSGQALQKMSVHVCVGEL